MHTIDWVIICAFLALMAGLTLYSGRFVVSVADFLAARRVAGRYLLTVSDNVGAIAIIALWEMVYADGLPTQWWSLMTLPVGLLLALTGFIIYRFRQTRALTLAQFFEMRYSRNFRIFAGLLAWISGVLNYGIFPAIMTRFFIAFFNLPEHCHLASLTIPTYPLMMALYLGFALFTALVGGQISIMMIDLVQSVTMMAVFVLLLVLLVHRFSWNSIIAGLEGAPAGHSMINPYKSSTGQFTLSYFLIAILSRIYNGRSWQGLSGSRAAAKTPHEAKMAGILGTWRLYVQQAFAPMVPIAAFAVLHYAHFTPLAATIQHRLSQVPNTQQVQLTFPIFLNAVLPVGMLGLVGAVFLLSGISTDNTYLHSWGTIFVQDVILPLRKTHFPPREHLFLLRLSIIGVALFAFIFSLLFPLKQYVLMYFAITGAIYLGGAGAVIIGGLYWSRGTTLAAWISLITGSILATGGMIAVQYWTGTIDPMLLRHFPHNPYLTVHRDAFPITGQTIYFLAMAAATLLYVVVSLIGPKSVHDLDKLLHRGAYALSEDALAGSVQHQTWRQLIGLTAEFSRSERILFWATFWWSIGWWTFMGIGTLLNYTIGLSDHTWSVFWWVKVWLLGLAMSAAFAIWFAIGGLRDAERVFADLRRLPTASDDDGTVGTESSTAGLPTAHRTTQ
jgi:SSS family solute:Na+ symporter